MIEEKKPTETDQDFGARVLHSLAQHDTLFDTASITALQAASKVAEGHLRHRIESTLDNRSFFRK